MGNVASVLSGHNRNILNSKISEFGCNCRSKTNCPLDKKCLNSKIVYQADVRNDTNDERNFTLGFLEHLLKSVSEITKKNLLTSSIGIALICQNIYGN